jgi:predicted nucleic acid-binding protein
VTRVFWDTMLFIYLFSDHPEYADQVRTLLTRSYKRGDTLLTSHLAVGEVMAGAKGDLSKAQALRSGILELGFSFLAFDERCIDRFERLRSVDLLKAQDSIHLSAAAQGNVDLFLTNDNQLLKRGLYVPGIRFIADFKLPIL